MVQKEGIEMSWTLRLVLILVSITTTSWILNKIRKSQARIDDSVFWIFFSFLLLILSIVPDIASFLSHILGIQSASNFIFLFMIFLLIIKIFLISIKISKLENQITVLTQEIALKNGEYYIKK